LRTVNAIVESLSPRQEFGSNLAFPGVDESIVGCVKMALI